MPNISFDVFFDKDFINITATRGQTAPKAKPQWKVRTAPKLPPKPAEQSANGTPRPPPRDKLTSTRQSLQKKPPSTSAADKAAETSNTASQTDVKERRKPPKLGPKKATPAPEPASE